MQSFYYDNIHFNRHEGLSVLKNALLSQLLRTSSGVSTEHYLYELQSQTHENQPIHYTKMAYTLLYTKIQITKRQRLLQ